MSLFDMSRWGMDDSGSQPTCGVIVHRLLNFREGNFMTSVRDFMTTNVGDREIMKAKKLVLYGTCIVEKYPNILEEYRKGRVALAVCLERDHMNMVAFKLATMVKSAKLEEIVVLTVDGSPHCVQLHQTVSEVNRLFDDPPSTRYFVVEHGNIHEIDAKVVKASRFLVKISKLMKK